MTTHSKYDIEKENGFRFFFKFETYCSQLLVNFIAVAFYESA